MPDHLEITEDYLALINALSCVHPDNAWIIAATIESGTSLHRDKKAKLDKDGAGDVKSDDKVVKRTVLDLKDLKGEYAKVLGNMSAQLEQLAGIAY